MSHYANCAVCIDPALIAYIIDAAQGSGMAKDDLVGNLATENILEYLQNHGVSTGINSIEFGKAVLIADEIFPKH